MRVCVFGDSTAWGAWDLEKGGWVNHLWLEVSQDRENYVPIYNLSVSGGTTETILTRFESEAQIREADALIFQTGGNDASYEGEPGNHLVPLERFEANIEEIIYRAKNMVPKIMFIGFKNCDESKTTPVSWCDFYYTNENIERYNRTMEAVCRRNDIPFLNTFGLLDSKDFEDGLHPNASGHQKIFQQVRKFLRKEGWF